MDTKEIQDIQKINRARRIRVGTIVGVILAIVIFAVILLIRHSHDASRLILQNPPVSDTVPIKDSTPVMQPQMPAVPVVAEPVLPVGTDRFVVSLSDTNATIAASLLSGGYISDADAFTALLGTETVTPGGYKIAKVMTPKQLVQVLSGKPYMVWVVVPEGLRKEEIADLLAAKLGWTKTQETTWITKSTTTDPNYIEGVYFPSTYLIPLGEAPADTGARLVSKFNEEFASYLPQFNKQNIKWTTGLTLASIVQREAANDADMPLIAGILWNRLNAGMPLDVDATLQYARGDTPTGWWAPITVADKKIDSPYNTYMNKGLPPHPISNPGIPAIEAVLNPATTDCLYYIHDMNHVTHCATTYAEQEANIQTYLVDPQATTPPSSQTTE